MGRAKKKPDRCDTTRHDPVAISRRAATCQRRRTTTPGIAALVLPDCSAKLHERAAAYVAARLKEEKAAPSMPAPPRESDGAFLERRQKEILALKREFRGKLSRLCGACAKRSARESGYCQHCGATMTREKRSK